MLGISVSTVSFNYSQQSRSQLTPLRPVLIHEVNSGRNSLFVNVDIVPRVPCILYIPQTQAIIHQVLFLGFASVLSDAAFDSKALIAVTQDQTVKDHLPTKH